MRSFEGDVARVFADVARMVLTEPRELGSERAGPIALVGLAWASPAGSTDAAINPTTSKRPTCATYNRLGADASAGGVDALAGDE